MSLNTGECIVNSPRAGDCIVFNYDQYDHFSQWSKNDVTKKKEQTNGVLECQNVHVSIIYLFPFYKKKHFKKCVSDTRYKTRCVNIRGHTFYKMADYLKCLSQIA